MNAPIWQPLPLTVNRVLAKPQALWTRVADYVAGPVKLKISAGGTWHASAAEPCGPEGRRGALVANGLVERALRGALIAKIGGSASDKPAEGATSFVVGDFTIVILDGKVEGPLFLTMNDDPAGFTNHKGSVQVVVEVARSA